LFLAALLEAEVGFAMESRWQTEASQHLAARTNVSLCCESFCPGGRT
jgi:hypothetical protein